MVQLWATPPEKSNLGADEVHVWKVHLDREVSRVPLFQRLLEPEEVARAQRFYFERDRQRWIVAHGLLRILLGRYLHIAPHLLRFDLNAYGKPALAFPTPSPPLHFNLSHSADLALYAFSWRRHIGVDVEYMRTTIDYDAIAQYSFSPSEQAALLSLSPTEKHEAFYRCWTRKEAYIKARGMGLSLPLDLFDVSFLPGEPAALLHSREDPQEMQRWSMRALAPAPDYAGALMVEGADWQLHCWQWPTSTPLL